MIKITHVEQNEEEEEVAIKIYDFLKKNYKGYFEVKTANQNSNIKTINRNEGLK